jgi:sugar phosphate isomerase/epimerase
MSINRRSVLGSVPAVAVALAAAKPLAALADPKVAHRNIKWAVSTNIWTHSKGPFTNVLDVMQATGFKGVRLTGFPKILENYGLTAAQLQSELAKRDLNVVTISFNGPMYDPQRRQETLDSARRAMTFLKDFGATHLVVFSPARKPETSTPAAFKEFCDQCNAVGELAGEMGFTAGLHNHMGQMVQTQEEVDRFMAMTNPKLFGLSPDTAHLFLGGCDVVNTFEHYKHRIKFMDYKDAKWTTPTADWVEPNGVVVPKDSKTALFLNSIYDLGDGQVDFPGCHRVLKSVGYEGWICVDLDSARLGPLADYQRCADYIVSKLQPVYL